jgi:Ca2+-binding RTX toxin-like protein
MQNLPSGALAPTINAGGSNNTLDYSAYTGDITVNLSLPTPTATALAGISGIENVTGSIGNDLLVGDANANVLIGGTGRNIIIGGGGADTLIGGGGDNLIIGGTTSYDQQADALALILKEWLQSSSFSDRMRAIENGTDLLAGTGIHFGADTVFPDGLANVTPGPGNNWIIS